jgi:hypothetical protein
MIEDEDRNVFINCPFDETYKPIFDAILFAVTDCGFVARCALEMVDSSQTRIDKIVRMIEECRFGIHDLSRTEPDPINSLPRFNMPLELGIFLGAKYLGRPTQRRKVCLVLDSERYRFQKFCSDIGGQDPAAHKNEPEVAVIKVRDFLSTHHPNGQIPSGRHIWKRFKQFQENLPLLCREAKLTQAELTFFDQRKLVGQWLMVQPDSINN